MLEIAPELANDEELKENLETLAKAFEAKMKALCMAHELAQQKLIADARIRNEVPMDVNELMEMAARQHTLNDTARQAMKQAAELPAVGTIVESVEAGTFMESLEQEKGKEDQQGNGDELAIDERSGIGHEQLETPEVEYPSMDEKAEAFFLVDDLVDDPMQDAPTNEPEQHPSSRRKVRVEMAT